jgi:hypothetical protein
MNTDLSTGVLRRRRCTLQWQGTTLATTRKVDASGGSVPHA